MKKSFAGTYLFVFVIVLFQFVCPGCGSSDNDGASLDNDNYYDNQNDYTDSGAVFIGEVRLFAGILIPNGFIPADGRRLLPNEHVVLYSLIGYTSTKYKTDLDYKYPDPFELPNIPRTWPSGAFSGNAGRWIIADKGIYPFWYEDSYYYYYWGQTFFSAIAGQYLRKELSQICTQDPGMAGALGDNIFTYEYNYFRDNVKTTDEVNAYNQHIEDPLIGELRLFKADTPLPEKFFKADGRTLSADTYQMLGCLIGNSYGGDWYRLRNFQLPNVQAPDGYVWAIAWNGYFPSF